MKPLTNPENENTATPAPEKQWENPANPEKPGDHRDIEQLERQKKEAELRRANLTDPDDTENSNN